MISAEDGYNKIIKQHVMDRLTTVLDFGKFYVYFFKPINENAKVIDIKDIYSMRVDELDRHK